MLIGQNKHSDTHCVLSFIHFRLVSAYEDKVICKRCTSKKLLKGSYKNLNDYTFPEFVDYILQEFNNSECSNSFNSPCFLVDVHWRPYNARCSYCDIPYNVIGRVETFEDDIKYILLKQNLANQISLDSTQLHMHKTVR